MFLTSQRVNSSLPHTSTQLFKELLACYFKYYPEQQNFILGHKKRPIKRDSFHNPPPTTIQPCPNTFIGKETFSLTSSTYIHTEICEVYYEDLLQIHVGLRE